MAVKVGWQALGRLTPSENHRGWTLVLNGDRIGEIFPLDEDGKEGQIYADSIPEKLNAFERGGAVERLVKYVNRNLIISDEYYEIIVELEALLPKKEGG